MEIGWNPDVLREFEKKLDFQKGATFFAIELAKRTLAYLRNQMGLRVTPVDKGELQLGWMMRKEGPMDYRLYNDVRYWEPHEAGSEPGKRPWPSVGPRTVEANGRIFSSQAPGGIWYNFQKMKALDELIEALDRVVFERV